MIKNYYDILGVSEKATDNEIRSKYLQLVKRQHPDVGGDQEQFVKIKEAYETLSDRQKRQQYDLELSFPNNMNNDFQKNSSFNKGYSFNFNDMNFMNFDFMSQGSHFNFSEMFLDLDVSIKLNISLQNACYGGLINAEYTYKTFEHDQRYTEKKDKINIQLKNSISKDKSLITIANKGHSLNNRRGDLKIRVHILPISNFYVEGLNIYQNVYVNFLDILLSRKVSVFNLQNNVKSFVLHPGMQDGDKICYKNAGCIPSIGDNKYGSYYFIIRVILPNKINEQERDALNSLSFQSMKRKDTSQTFLSQ